MPKRYIKVFSNDYQIYGTHARVEKYFDKSFTDKILDELVYGNPLFYKWNDQSSFIFDEDKNRRDLYESLTFSDRAYLMDELRRYSDLYGGDIYEGGFREAPCIIMKREYSLYDIDVCYSYKGIRYHKKLKRYRPYNDNVNQIPGFDITISVEKPENVKRIREHTVTVIELLKSLFSK